MKNQPYSLQIEKLINIEFNRLDNITYLEHAGATLYSEKQISNVFEDLRETVYANPHAKSTTSKSTEDAIDQIRYQILQHFATNNEEYSVIFTSGATGALKLVAESFNYANGGYFTYLEDNHTSVLGMRSYAQQSQSISRSNAYETFAHESSAADDNSNSLFVYPAQCNFSGFKYPLAWIEKVQAGALNRIESLKSKNWFCMLDAASFVATNFLDLSIYKPDFVCMSFYKLFGYPSGIGALLVRNSSAWVLEKRYYGGGTVLMSLSSENVVVRRKTLHERFEDGTIPFLSIIALRHGFDTFTRLNLTMKLISKHTYFYAKYVYDNLILIHHNNGQKGCILYHDELFENIEHQGGIINFNLLRPNGTYIGYAEVMHMANLYGIQLRTGCFCNPGACQRHLKLSNKDIRHHFQQGHVCGDQNDLIDGCPTGSVRISFGYMSKKKDADDFLDMIKDCFISQPIIMKLPVPNNTKHVELKCLETKIRLDEIKGTLDQVYVYPIKSCGPFSVESHWDLVNTGLKFDREWMIVNQAGVCLTQKQETKLCLIKPFIDLKENNLILSYQGMQNIGVPLKFEKLLDTTTNAYACQSKVCGDKIEGLDCGEEIAVWLSAALNIKGLRLLRQCNSNGVARKTRNNDNKLSLVNKAQFLMVNRTSVQWLLDCIPTSEFYESINSLIDRFRPNFIVSFPKAFDENGFNKFSFGNTHFLSEGQCTRCQMICIDQSTGDKSIEPLRTLSREFNGKISFGIYLKQENVMKSDKIYINSEIICS